MKVTFLREGFANNSSSSHSIIFSGNKSLKSIEERYEQDYGFGWDEFVIKSNYVKFVYMMNSLFSFIYDNHSAASVSYLKGWNYDDRIKRMVEEFDTRLINVILDDVGDGLGSSLNAICNNSNFLKRYFQESNDKSDRYRYYSGNSGMGFVDHQSLISLPKMRDGEKLNKRFAVCLIKEIVEKNYLILGGNDNSDTSHKSDFDKFIPKKISKEKDSILRMLLFLKDNRNLIMAKYDEVADHFVVSSKSGPIMFVSFSDNLVGSSLEG